MHRPDPRHPRALSLWMSSAVASGLLACNPGPTPPPGDGVDTDDPPGPGDTGDTDVADTLALDDTGDTDVADTGTPEDTLDTGGTGDTGATAVPVDTAPCQPPTDPGTLLPDAWQNHPDTAAPPLDFYLNAAGCEWPDRTPAAEWVDLCLANPTLLSGFDPAIPTDHLALLGYIGYVSAPGLEIGTPCDGAADVAQCMSDYQSAVWALGANHVVASTDGGTIELWTDPADVAAILAPITSPVEAGIMTWTTMQTYLGWPFTCQPGRGFAREVSTGWEVVTAEVLATCPVRNGRTRYHVTTDGVVTVLETQILAGNGDCIGRPPAGLHPLPARDASTGDRFARHAALEAASAYAFAHLRRELAHHGAPASLRRAARRAESDELRHADQVGALARAHGCAPRVPTITALPLRSLEALARDNAIHGCVGETLGAMAALAEARTTDDPRIAEVLTALARDEARHAALSWRIHAWALERLDGGAADRVRAALREAMAAPVSGDGPVDPAVMAALQARLVEDLAPAA